jgi:hypothetical protein
MKYVWLLLGILLVVGGGYGFISGLFLSGHIIYITLGYLGMIVGALLLTLGISLPDEARQKYLRHMEERKRVA